MKSHHEYQGDRYRELIIDIRKCEELLKLYEELEVSANSKTWQRACEIRDMFWASPRTNSGSMSSMFCMTSSTSKTRPASTRLRSGRRSARSNPINKKKLRPAKRGF